MAENKGVGQTDLWKTGKVVDENRARQLFGVHHSGQSSTSSSGTWGGTAQSTSAGDTINTNANGTYSGSSSTSSSRLDMPLYKVYENLVIEGDDMVYITSERLRWRWSKGARVTVNGEVKFYADGRKLHLLDDAGKEHVVEIVKQIRKDTLGVRRAIPIESPPAMAAILEIVSTPPGADIEIDGNFVGNSPSSLSISQGNHTLRLTKKGYNTWERKLTVFSGKVTVAAELEQ